MATPQRHVLHVGYLPPAPVDEDDGAQHTLIVDALTAAGLTPQQRSAFTRIQAFPLTTVANVGCYDRELDAITAAAAELSARCGAPSHVVGLGEHVAVPAALLRDTYGCPGTDLQAAHRCRDKIDMKRAVAAAGIPVPRAWEISETTAPKVLAEIATAGSGPLILKPRSLAGSLGVHVLHNTTELASYLEHHGVDDDVEVEEFVDGDILHLNGVVRDGTVIFFSASRYLTAPVSFEQERVPLASVRITDEEDLRRAREFARRTVAAVGLRDSVFHLEAFETATGLVFLEIAARFGGAGVRPHLDAVYGVNLLEEAYLACTDGPSRIRPEHGEARFAHSGWLITPLPADGRFRVTEDPEVDVDSLGVVWSRMPAAGDVIDSALTFVPTGLFVVTGDSEEELRSRLGSLADRYSVTLEPV